MGANQVDLAYAFVLPPERAIRYFETLGYTVPTDWPQRMQQAAAKAQTIAGIYRQDVVADIHRALGESAAKGTPFAKFRDAVERQLTAKGLHLDQAGDMVDTATGELLGKGITPQRLEVIYRTNMQNAYMAGRWQELQDNRAAMPYLQYTAVMDNRTCPLHRELHGQVYHIDDPFWDTFYPPNGFNCRCTVTAYSAADLTRRGLEVSDSEGRLEEVYRVVNKAGDTEPTRAIRLADGRSFIRCGAAWARWMWPSSPLPACRRPMWCVPYSSISTNAARCRNCEPHAERHLCTAKHPCRLPVKNVTF